jgi:hypothetical protein
VVARSALSTRLPQPAGDSTADERCRGIASRAGADTRDHPVAEGTVSPGATDDESDHAEERRPIELVERAVTALAVSGIRGLDRPGLTSASAPVSSSRTTSGSSEVTVGPDGDSPAPPEAYRVELTATAIRGKLGFPERAWPRLERSRSAHASPNT